jgi:hypothetical protein
MRVPLNSQGQLVGIGEHVTSGNSDFPPNDSMNFSFEMYAHDTVADILYLVRGINK